MKKLVNEQRAFNIKQKNSVIEQHKKIQENIIKLFGQEPSSKEPPESYVNILKKKLFRRK